MENANVRRGLGNGLLLSEGNSWKMKKKVLQEVFNFNFIKGQSLKMAELTDNVLDKMEESSRSISGEKSI